MAELQFAAPETVNQAIKILGGAKGKGRILAGGTDLLVQMRSGRIEPGFIVDVKNIPELTEIKKEKTGTGWELLCQEPDSENISQSRKNGLA